MKSRFISIFIFLFLFCFFSLISITNVKASEDIFGMSLEDLVNITVTTASGVEESLIDAPAAMIVVTSNDIQNNNYQSLFEVISDISGFDIIESSPNTFYQRGYRTPFASRTLFMVNGIVDNHLWTHVAQFSTQYPISNIDKIEVLYGPASVIYGPNAYLGIINIITKNAGEMADGDHTLTVRAESGSWHSYGGELSALGNVNDIKYSFSARFYKSDEEDLSNRWGFLSNDLYSNNKIWGPILTSNSINEPVGSYKNPTDDWGVLADISYKNLTAGLIYWKNDEGYRGNYPADRGQSFGSWTNQSKQFYLKYDWQVNDKLDLSTTALYRKSTSWIYWAEAEPDWREGMQEYSFVSSTYWSSTNDAYEFKQDAIYTFNEQLSLIAGWRYKYLDLTKAWDVPGYWAGSYGSTNSVENTGPYGFGEGVFNSQDLDYTFTGQPLSEVPRDNRITSNDKGAYIGAIYDVNAWRFNLGIRKDKNSIFGSSLSPRISSIYKFNNGESAIKLIYGEAFQEPPSTQLYGGWSGRNANPDLKPEKAKNIELIFMHNTTSWLHDVSLFNAEYENVIRESAINDAKRDILGLEYRGRFEYQHFVAELPAITGSVYYTYTKPKTSLTYDHSLGLWIDKTDTLGDIAPHKINTSIHFPIFDELSLTLKGHFVSKTQLYSRNPLHEQGVELGSKVMFDMILGFKYLNLKTSLKVKNIFDRLEFYPGLRSANSGNDFTQRSKGYDNSLIPQAGRSISLTLAYEF